jgi:CDP-4-dehydro-6-deoxyglucose reductase, E3
MPTVSTLNGKFFDCNAQETLLDAALRANVVLEHSCKTGRCGSCKAKATVGATVALLDETSLTLREKLSGWVLTCARTAIADVQLQVEDLGDYKLSAAKTVPCRIHTLEKLAPDVVKVVLRLPPQQTFSYLPGQYIDVIGHESIRRSYSVANAPTADKLIELHIRQVQAGSMSQYWFKQAKPNDLLRLNGPLGTFFLRSVAGLDLVFLATGTGIAPVKAMLEGLSGLSQCDLPRSISVYWGARTEQDLYWSPEKSTVHYQFTPVLSRPGASWSGLRGHVQQALLASNPDLSQTVVYACGSDAMIHSARQALAIAGLPDNKFLSDAFVASSNNPIK